MDPRATLTLWAKATDPEDKAEHLANYREWVVKGGYRASASAQGASESGYGDASYAEYLDLKAAEYAHKLGGEYYWTRSLSEALAGNNGD